ncbi:S-4TM family putative pore-forming effector [Dehalobacter sp. TBBPA1]|uniref:S-4TM family putative pore-forming effector n=1 Tax=Dehalobacter sp. TBBPA1 TaxID=3235037 RepID=UPI0034A1CBEC
MSVNAIEKKQNEERMLRYQYASRRYYNRAETLNDLVWMCLIISWFAIFLPDSSHWGMLFIALPFFTDIIATILNWRMNINVSSASALRKYFDAYVLCINIDQYTGSEVQELEELSIKAIKNSPKKSKEQMANTGRDTPPGVRNWYEFSQPLSEQDAKYECQKQNCWWNKKITHERIIRSGIELLVFVVLAIFFVINAKTNAGIIQVIFSSGGLIIKCAERLVANGKYYMLSLKIDGALDILTNSRSDENIKNLQAKIDMRRAMPVLERNHIHKRNAKKYSELYHDIKKVGL